jgi:hypothetical protein
MTEETSASAFSTLAYGHAEVAQHREFWHHLQRVAR